MLRSHKLRPFRLRAVLAFVSGGVLCCGHQRTCERAHEKPANEKAEPGQKMIFRNHFLRSLRPFSRQVGTWRYQENGRNR